MPKPENIILSVSKPIYEISESKECDLNEIFYAPFLIVSNIFLISIVGSEQEFIESTNPIFRN